LGSLEALEVDSFALPHEAAQTSLSIDETRYDDAAAKTLHKFFQIKIKI
jgi:hypothetical protein